MKTTLPLHRHHTFVMIQSLDLRKTSLTMKRRRILCWRVALTICWPKLDLKLECIFKHHLDQVHTENNAAFHFLLLVAVTLNACHVQEAEAQSVLIITNAFLQESEWNLDGELNDAATAIVVTSTFGDLFMNAAKICHNEDFSINDLYNL